MRYLLIYTKLKIVNSIESWISPFFLNSSRFKIFGEIGRLCWLLSRWILAGLQCWILSYNRDEMRYLLMYTKLKIVSSIESGISPGTINSFLNLNIFFLSIHLPIIHNWIRLLIANLEMSDDGVHQPNAFIRMSDNIVNCCKE